MESLPSKALKTSKRSFRPFARPPRRGRRGHRPDCAARGGGHARLPGRARSGIHVRIPESANSGALLTYGPNLGELAPRAAEYVDRIPKGAKPGDLLLEGPNRYYLMVNGRTANSLGISLPEAILPRADEVIEQRMRI